MEIPELTVQFGYHDHFENHVEDALEGADLEMWVRVSFLVWGCEDCEDCEDWC